MPCWSPWRKNASHEYLEGMAGRALGPTNSAMSLTTFGERLNGMDPEDVICKALACFDKQASGFMPEDHLRELLITMRNPFTDEEVDDMYREAPTDREGNSTTQSVPASSNMVPRSKMAIGLPAPGAWPHPVTAPHTLILTSSRAPKTPPVGPQGRKWAIRSTRPGSGHMGSTRQVLHRDAETHKCPRALQQRTTVWGEEPEGRKHRRRSLKRTQALAMACPFLG